MPTLSKYFLKIFNLYATIGAKEFSSMTIIKNPFDFVCLSRQRPAMYWSRKSLHDVYNFMLGFVHGRNNTDLGNDARTLRFFETNEDGFQHFVSSKLEHIPTTRSWSMIIEENAVSADEAFELFFKLLDEYFEK